MSRSREPLEGGGDAPNVWVLGTQRVARSGAQPMCGDGGCSEDGYDQPPPARSFLGALGARLPWGPSQLWPCQETGTPPDWHVILMAPGQGRALGPGDQPVLTVTLQTGRTATSLGGSFSRASPRVTCSWSAQSCPAGPPAQLPPASRSLSRPSRAIPSAAPSRTTAETWGTRWGEGVTWRSWRAGGGGRPGPAESRFWAPFLHCSGLGWSRRAIVSRSLGPTQPARPPSCPSSGWR